MPVTSPPDEPSRGASATGSRRAATRQQEAGAAMRAETRRRLLQAAAEEFAEKGYTGATVAAIAARAGVTVQTLYLAWGSKLALLEGFLDESLTGRPEPGVVGPGREAMLAPLNAAAGDAVRMVAVIAALFRHICERAGLAWRLYRDASAAHPDVAAAWARLHTLRRGTFDSVLARIPSSALRPGLSVADAVDTAWAIASPETFDLFTRYRGYTMDEYEVWVRSMLLAALIDPALVPGGGAAPDRAGTTGARPSDIRADGSSGENRPASTGGAGPPGETPRA